MRIHFPFFGLVVVGICLCLQAAPVATDDSCAVTSPNGIVAGTAAVKAWSHGNARLSVGPFGLWPEGTVVFRPNGPGFTTTDGGLGMKFGWTRGIAGAVDVSGHRIDGEASALIVEMNDGYGGVGFQASYLIFPTPGCWEVTARVRGHEDSRLTFITKVLKLGEGPAARRVSTRR